MTCNCYRMNNLSTTRRVRNFHPHDRGENEASAPASLGGGWRWHVKDVLDHRTCTSFIWLFQEFLDCKEQSIPDICAKTMNLCQQKETFQTVFDVPSGFYESWVLWISATVASPECLLRPCCFSSRSLLDEWVNEWERARLITDIQALYSPES